MDRRVLCREDTKRQSSGGGRNLRRSSAAMHHTSSAEYDVANVEGGREYESAYAAICSMRSRCSLVQIMDPSVVRR